MSKPLSNSYMIMDDLPSAIEQLLQQSNESSRTEATVREAAEELVVSMTGTIRNAYPDAFFIDAKQLVSRVHQLIGEFLATYPEAEILSLDKYLPTGMNRTVHRFGMTRTAHGSPVPRPGFNGTADDQLRKLDSAIGNKPIILVDDCLSSGGTLRQLLHRTRGTTGRSWKESVVAIVVGEGPADANAFEDIPTRIAYPFSALQDGVMTADLTPFGGRTVDVSPDLQVARAAPYSAPFADGRHCSLDVPDDEVFFETHRRLLVAQETFFIRMNSVLPTALTLNQWTRFGFPAPRSIDPAVHETTQKDEVRLSDIVTSARQALDEHRSLRGANRNAITDFDNTLYGCIGGGSYSTARIAQAHDNAVRLMIGQYKEGEEAEALYQRAVSDPLTSMVLAEALGRTRLECLNDVWGNMDPQECCEPLVHTLPALDRIRTGTAGKLIVLTAVPKVRIDRVLKHIGIDRHFFDEIITCEQHRTKADVFNRMKDVLEGPTLAIGDDMQSDVIPAIAAGMRGITVDNRVRSLHYVSRLF